MPHFRRENARACAQLEHGPVELQRGAEPLQKRCCTGCTEPLKHGEALSTSRAVDEAVLGIAKKWIDEAGALPSDLVQRRRAVHRRRF